MSADDRPIRWRLTGIRATGDDTRLAAVVSAVDGQTREYVFSRDDTTIGGEPAFIWHTGGWDRHTLFDAGSYKAVLDAVLALHAARQRLCEIRATESDSRYVAVLAGPDGQTHEHPFVWDAGEGEALFDRASLDAVNAFHEARQREMALGDDENRKPPGL